LCSGTSACNVNCSRCARWQALRGHVGLCAKCCWSRLQERMQLRGGGAELGSHAANVWHNVSCEESRLHCEHHGVALEDFRECGVIQDATCYLRPRFVNPSQLVV